MTQTPRRGKIIVFGILFWYPLAGVTYQFLHYLLALRRLGYDPYYVEDSERWVYSPREDDLVPDSSANIAALAPILEAYGFKDRWVFRGDFPERRCYGLSEDELAQLYREADAFLNVTGSQELREEHLSCRRRIYVETDPVAAQINVANQDPSTLAALAAHDTHFSFGENLGAPDCGVPLERFHWLPTRQPVALDLWPFTPPPVVGRYTTITTWQSRGKDITHAGETYYWSKDREFRKVIDLPARCGASLELATQTDPSVKQLLEGHGWYIVDPVKVSGQTAAYRDYIQQSRGEFTVAKDQNIRLRSGWFSDRSACYLAAGRPVITQETGFSNVLPTGRGLFSFQSMDDILEAFEAIEGNYPLHCRAAREVADEYFSAEKVVASLMARAGL